MWARRAPSVGFADMLPKPSPGGEALAAAKGPLPLVPAARNRKILRLASLAQDDMLGGGAWGGAPTFSSGSHRWRSPILRRGMGRSPIPLLGGRAAVKIGRSKVSSPVGFCDTQQERAIRLFELIRLRFCGQPESVVYLRNEGQTQKHIFKICRGNVSK